MFLKLPHYFFALISRKLVHPKYICSLDYVKVGIPPKADCINKSYLSSLDINDKIQFQTWRKAIVAEISGSGKKDKSGDILGQMENNSDKNASKGMLAGMGIKAPATGKSVIDIVKAGKEKEKAQTVDPFTGIL